MLSWMRLCGITTVSHPSRLASWYKFTLLDEEGHRSVSRLSRAISQKVGGLGNQTGNPSISGPIPLPHIHWPARLLFKVSILYLDLLMETPNSSFTRSSNDGTSSFGSSRSTSFERVCPTSSTVKSSSLTSYPDQQHAWSSSVGSRLELIN